MPKVCIYRPNRTHKRPVDPKTAARFYCTCRRRGWTHKELISEISKKCGGDPCGRRRVRRYAREVAQQLSIVQHEMVILEDNLIIFVAFLAPFVIYLRNVVSLVSFGRLQKLEQAHPLQNLSRIKDAMAEANFRVVQLERFVAEVKAAA